MCCQASDRRDRLRDHIAKMISAGEEIPEFRKDRKQLEIDLATIAEKINKDRPYFSRGNPWIKVARTRILKFSMKRAAKRVAIQLKQRENPLPSNAMKLDQKEVQNRLSQFKCQATHYDKTEGARPFYCCSISSKFSNHKVGDQYAILMGNQGGDITIWNEGGVMKRKIIAHEERLTGLAIMPSNHTSPVSVDVELENFEALKFISASADGLVKLWNGKGESLGIYDAAKGAPKHKRNGPRERMGKCAFHPIGSYFGATNYDRSWALWDIEKTDMVLLRQEGHSTSVHCCGFHPDGSLMATGDLGGIVRIWDLRSGRAIWGGDSHAKAVLAVDFNVNGYIMASSSMDNTIKIWDLRKHTEYTIPAHDNLISAVRFESNKGEWAVSGSFDKTVRIWSMKKRGSYNFKLTHQMKGHHSRISDLCISDDANFIVTASHDKTWKLWSDTDFDIQTKREETTDIVIKKEENV